MADEAFTLSYLKCQETFLIDVVRRCLEAESKISILQNTVKEREVTIEEQSGKITELNEHLMQTLAGLEATTIQRDTLRDEHSKYRDEILALGELKEKCDKIEKNYEEHMKNYNLVNEAYQKLQAEYQTLLDTNEKLVSSEKKVNKVVKLEQPKKDDWS